MGSTLLEKIWRRHEIQDEGERWSLLYVDRNLVHEESSIAFDALRSDAIAIHRVDSHAAFSDHYAPTLGREKGLQGIDNAEIRRMLTQLARNASRSGLRHFDIDDERQGIMHVASAEQGMALPGTIITGSDSHTCTLGAFGAFAFGIGQTELMQVFATNTLWRRRPRCLLVRLDGQTTAGVAAKDVVMAVIGAIGPATADGHAIEFSGSYVDRLTMDERMTLCNMAIEAGAITGLIAPDEITFDYLAGRSMAPAGALREAAIADWRALRSDTDAQFDARIHIDVAQIVPMVTWGTAADQVVAVSGRVPDPATLTDAGQQRRRARALEYMGLAAGVAIEGLPIDVAFIGSCTNSRLQDLRVAAAVLQGRRARVRAVVSPGSRSVKRLAEAEGLHHVFEAAGFEWRDSGCSMCVGSNGDVVGAGLRCASSSPRSFEGRQGVGARTHVMSPAMVAAAAVSGFITDVRRMLPSSLPH